MSPKCRRVGSCLKRAASRLDFKCAIATLLLRPTNGCVPGSQACDQRKKSEKRQSVFLCSSKANGDQLGTVELFFCFVLFLIDGICCSLTSSPLTPITLLFRPQMCRSGFGLKGNVGFVSRRCWEAVSLQNVLLTEALSTLEVK